MIVRLVMMVGMMTMILFSRHRMLVETKIARRSYAMSICRLNGFGFLANFVRQLKQHVMSFLACTEKPRKTQLECPFWWKVLAVTKTLHTYPNTHFN